MLLKRSLTTIFLGLSAFTMNMSANALDLNIEAKSCHSDKCHHHHHHHDHDRYFNSIYLHEVSRFTTTSAERTFSQWGGRHADSTKAANEALDDFLHHHARAAAVASSLGLDIDHTHLLVEAWEHATRALIRTTDNPSREHVIDEVIAWAHLGSLYDKFLDTDDKFHDHVRQKVLDMEIELPEELAESELAQDLQDARHHHHFHVFRLLFGLHGLLNAEANVQARNAYEVASCCKKGHEGAVTVYSVAQNYLARSAEYLHSAAVGTIIASIIED